MGFVKPIKGGHPEPKEIRRTLPGAGISRDFSGIYQQFRGGTEPPPSEPLSASPRPCLRCSGALSLFSRKGRTGDHARACPRHLRAHARLVQSNMTTLDQPDAEGGDEQRSA